MTSLLAPGRYGWARPRPLRSGDTLRIIRGGEGAAFAPFADLPLLGPVTISALPQTANLQMMQGDTWFLTLTIWDPEGAAVPMEQVVVKSQVRAAVADLDTHVLAEFTTSTIDNRITLFLSSPDTTPLRGNAVWDCQITDPNGWVTTLAAGTVHITAEVTR